MIRNVLRCLNEAKYGPIPEKPKQNADNSKHLRHLQTASIVDLKDQTAPQLQCDEAFNIGDDILINKNFVVHARKYCVNQLNKSKRVSYLSINSDKQIINLYFEDYMHFPAVNWREMVSALKQSGHDRLVLLGIKIEEFKSSLREFERSLEAEYDLSEISSQSEESAEENDINEEKLVEARLRQHTVPFPNSGGLYVKRDYIKGKGYYVKSVHITKSLIDMVGWTVEDFMMECALTRQHPECILTNYYLENLVQTLECIKYSFLQKEYTSTKESISLLHKSSQIFEAKCEVVSIPKTGDFIMRIEIPETLSFSEDSATLQLFKTIKPKKFTFTEKQFIESFYSTFTEESIDRDEEEILQKTCKYRVVTRDRIIKC